MFKRMYLLLFNRVTDAIEAIEHGNAAQARTVLIRAQQDAEALYIDGMTAVSYGQAGSGADICAKSIPDNTEPV